MDDERETLSMKPFFIIWGGQAVSLLGSQLVQFAIIWWLTRTSGSATLLAMASLAGLLPQILLGPFAGALVDRWSRKWVMVGADTLTALATLVLALLFWTNAAQMWMIYALLMMRATGAAFQWPAMQASTTLMVPRRHLPRVAGLNQALLGAVAILIPPLGAVAVEALPMQAVLGIDVLTAIPAIGCTLLTAIPQPQRAVTSGIGTSVWNDMRAGLRFTLKWKGLLMFALMGVLIGLLGRAAGSLTPLLITQHFKGGALQLGTWESACGIGTIIGGILLGVWGGSQRRLLASLLALALDGIIIVFIALCPENAFLAAIVLAAVTAGLETIVLGLHGAIGQTVVPTEMQGRVFALIMSASQGLAPLGLLLAGPVADAFGVQFWWLLTGILILIVGGGALFVPDIMHIEDAAYQPNRETASRAAV